MTHDPLCPELREEQHYCCSECTPGVTPYWETTCQCDLIAKVRADEAPKAVTRWIEQGASSDDWMKVWQVRDYAEELEAKVRADERDKTLDDAIALLWEMNCKRLWWDDMLTWCISVNEAIYNIDNLRGKREVV